MADHHTIIVGGGVIGISCAHELARRGSRVTVLERDEVAGAASYGNAGALAPGHGPINGPGRVVQALRSMLRPTSPLYVAPRVDPALIRWLWSFRAHCTARHVERSLEFFGPAGHRSAEAFRRNVREEGIDCAFRDQGFLDVYLSERGLREGQEEADGARRHGYDFPRLSGDEVREREPAFTSAVRGAIWIREGVTCDPHRYVTGLAARAEERGATIRAGVAVEEILVGGGRARGVRTGGGETLEADTVLLATGVYSQHLLRSLRLGLPLQAAKGYHRDTAPADGEALFVNTPCRLVENAIFCNPVGDFVRFAGTLEFSGVNHVLRRGRLEQLDRGARPYLRLPEGGEVRSEWCGLRPCLPDGLPAIGWVGVEGLFVATGHAMMGLTLGPITAELAVETILDGHPSMDLQAVRPDRF
jgi:D-amino-acid dehydrogenase